MGFKIGTASGKGQLATCIKYKTAICDEQKASLLIIYRGRTVGNTVVDSSCCSSSIFSINNASSAGSYCGFASFFGGQTGLQRTAGEKKIGKIAKRIVLDLTFDGRIAIIKYYSVSLAEFSSKMPMKLPKEMNKHPLLIQPSTLNSAEIP